MIRRSEAIVLRSMRYGETSRIVTAFTKDFGRVSLIAKGARGAKPKFGAALEPMSHSVFVYYHRDQRELQLLSQADLVRQFSGIVYEPAGLMLGFAVIEYLAAVLHGEEEHPELFALLRDGLTRLDAAERNRANILARFLCDLSAALGFSLAFDRCSRCGTPFETEQAGTGTMRFDTLAGGFACPSCAKDAGGTAVPAPVFRELRWLALAEADRLSALNPPADHTHQMLRILHLHLSTHVQGLRAISSLALLDTLS